MSKATRSFKFDRYLEKLRMTDLDRYLHLVRIERLFSYSWYERLVDGQMLLDAQMSGYVDPPAGRTVPVVYSSGGDWAWQPERDQKVGENMVTFRGVPKGPAELSHGAT